MSLQKIAKLPPVIIGGKGGSGTRVFAEIVAELGCYQGPCNASSDVVLWAEFIHKYQIPYLDKWWKGQVTSQDHVDMAKDFEPYLKKYLEGNKDFKVPTWKNPQGMHILPFYHQVFPEMKFIHALRDGRDMVFSKNENEFIQAKKTDIWNSVNAGELAKKIKFWYNSNHMVSEYGKNNMKDNYVSFKFEDLCDNPRETIIKIAKFIDAPVNEEKIQKCMRLVKKPRSIGRWKKATKQQQERLLEVGEEGLRYFGYMTDTK